MDQRGLCAGPRVAARGHLDVMRIKRFERVFPDTDHNAPLVSPRILDGTGLVEIPILIALAFLGGVAAVPVRLPEKTLTSSRPLPITYLSSVRISP
jgi:hypothetical protein